MLILFCFEMGSHVVQASLKPSVQLRHWLWCQQDAHLDFRIFLIFTRSSNLLPTLFFIFAFIVKRRCYDYLMVLLFSLIHQVLCESTHLEKFPQVS